MNDPSIGTVSEHPLQVTPTRLQQAPALPMPEQSHGAPSFVLNSPDLLEVSLAFHVRLPNWHAVDPSIVAWACYPFDLFVFC